MKGESDFLELVFFGGGKSSFFALDFVLDFELVFVLVFVLDFVLDFVIDSIITTILSMIVSPDCNLGRKWMRYPCLSGGNFM